MTSSHRQYKFAEFFAGGGMANLGLGLGWECVLANDICPKKCASYRVNFGDNHLFEGDVNNLDLKHLLQPIDLYWASSPCQDFSLAGKGEGLQGQRAGAFSGWYKAFKHSVNKGYGPRIIAFENVVGLVSRNNGNDFLHIVNAIADLGYTIGAVEIDAVKFLPQSRPRLFVIAVRNDIDVSHLIESKIENANHAKKILRFVKSNAMTLTKSWVFWKLDVPQVSSTLLGDVIDTRSNLGFSTAKVDHLINIMSDAHRQITKAKIEESMVSVGTLYKRGRPDSEGKIRQRAEVRFDGIAGCLRTPRGGSSKQTVLIVGCGQLVARLITPRECARLMGLPESYILPDRDTDAYHLMGDGVAVPVVSYLEKNLFQPILNAAYLRAAA